MNIIMQESESEFGLICGRWDAAIVGPALDARGRSAHEFVRQRSTAVFEAQYDAREFVLSLADARFDADDQAGIVADFRGSEILLESTTLGFVEIFLICRGLYELGHPRVTLLYVEPERYKQPRRRQVLHRRDFELSEGSSRYIAIPGATTLLSERREQHVVFLLGYEQQRLDRALEDNQAIKPHQCISVFGVPAFRPGWELNAFANNVNVIEARNLNGGIHFVGAENPASVVDLLESLHRGRGRGETLFVAPIGTKPNGIGAAIFAARHRDVGLLYDHPKRAPDRTNAVARWHLFEVALQDGP